MTAQSGLGFSGIVAIQIPDDGAPGTVLTKLTADNYDYDWLAGGGGASTIIVEDEGAPVGVPADTLDFVGAGVTASGAGTTKTITIPGGASSLQAAYDFATAPPQIVVNGTPDPVTIDASVAGDVFAVTDVAGADLIRMATTGSQIAGGSNASNLLTLQGSNAANRGRNILAGGADIDWDWTSDAITSGGLRFANVIPASGGIINASIFIANTITVNAALFIQSALDDNSTLNWTVAPGFAVTTLFFARQTYRGLNAGIPPAQTFVYAAQCAYDIQGAGTITVGTYRALSFAPILRCRNAGDNLTITNVNGVTVGPLWNTNNATAIVDFGTIRGVHMLNPAQALFGQSLGTERMNSYIGLDMNNITLTFTGEIAVVRSAVTAGTDKWFLLNNSTAESDFGAGDIHFDDNTYIKFGGTIAAADIWIGWQSADNVLNFSTVNGVGGNPLQLNGTAADEWNFQQNPAGTQDIGIRFDVNAIVFGNAATATPNSNNWFGLFGPPNGRLVQIGGEYSDFLFSAGGSADIDGNAVSNFQNFKFNAPAFILNGGTVTDASNIFVDGMLSFGATLVQALRVTGRSTLRGRINQPSEQPAQITANQNDYQLAANNGQRGVAILDSDAAYNITGIDSSFGRSQDAERITLVNRSSFALTLTHQDVLSLAANRFISPTGVSYVLGPNESCEIYYLDDGTDRWLILWGSGA